MAINKTKSIFFPLQKKNFSFCMSLIIKKTFQRNESVITKENIIKTKEF